MCARLLACPLCSQPGFLTLDALRTGLVSVATRPLVCPVCNEVLLGIDKLTIHLFGHTINLNSNATMELSKHTDVVPPDDRLIAVHNLHNVAPQNWNALKTQELSKTQASCDNSATCTESSDSGASAAGNKIHVMNSQSQARSRDLLGKGAAQPIVSDYNYDVIKINILPQQNENQAAALGPTVNLQEVLKTHCAAQSFCNSDIKELNVPEENAQTEKTVSVSDFADDWMEKQRSLIAAKVTATVEANVYQAVECAESNRRVAKERPMMNLMSKENDLSDFRSIEDAVPICCVDASLQQRHDDKQSPRDANETNAEDQDHSSKEQRRIAQTCAKILQSATPKERTERCDICGFHFPDVNILALHQQLVHEQESENVSRKVLKNYSCHLCSKVFKMRGSLMVHMRVVHIGHNLGSLPKDGQMELAHGDVGYNCPTCGKRFKKEQHVMQHLKTHEGKQWECDVCSKMFTTKYFLKKHKRLHSGEMPYKCKICDKNFTFQQSYHKHRLYHKDDKPHTCATCGRSFKELSTLHNHERIHTGEKPFACETCGKCFRQRVSYLVHRRIHTGVMPYKCTLCGKSFRYKVSQRTHKCPVQGNPQQSSDTIAQKTNDETVKLQASNISQSEGQSIVNTVDKEENKFVLIINAQGQHVLALQSEVNNMPLEKEEQNLEFESADNTKNSKNKTWSTNNPDSVKLKESSGTLEKTELGNEKINMKNDFLSLMMSRLENSVSSSTFEMEHLRVSSPKQKENLMDSYADFAQISDNAQMNLVDSSMEQNLTRDKNVADSLQTINVESLKELLYSIDEK
ncbi:zinc finger protein 415 [Odontomachus brunneus]|uniref:zinc finger protein 415 n=1 Tax=Odontomachus brunneus TaxID=486640 RepID=UPI0013F1E2DC|nr:zinc finger protein 415 [Odontomachus brunneus]